MPVEGYVSLDSQPKKGVDVICRVPPIPYEADGVAHIYAGHFLEHLPPWEVFNFLLECKRVLQPGGTLTLVVPDAHKARVSALSARLGLRAYDLILQGDMAEDMPHYTIWTQTRLEEALRRAGFVVAPEYDWRHDERVFDRNAWWQCGAQGVKP
jgi:predicted SAM-dependent methyltransferase